MIMKTQEELNILKEEVKAINEKLKELTEEELTQVTGGIVHMIGGIIPTGKRDVEFPPCYAWPENLTFVTPEDCAVCEYYVSCYNPDKA